MAARLGIDIGRTFTELALLDEGTGQVHTSKVFSEPKGSASSFSSGLSDFLASSDIPATEVTTVVTSTSSPLFTMAAKHHTKVALLTTQGFEHTLLLGGIPPEGVTSSPHLAVYATPPADLAMTRGVPERVTANGEVIHPLDTDAASGLIEEVVNLGAEHIAISLLHSYANPIHERMLRDLVREINPLIPITISTEVRRVFREYERTTLTVLNAYLHTSMKEQLESLDTRLKNIGISSDILVGRSDGGTMTATRAQRSPVFANLATSAFYAAAARRLSTSLSLGDSVSLNWTGNTTEITFINSRQQTHTRNGSTELYSLNLPTLGTKCIGPGADGHIRVSETGRIIVDQAPEFESSPACYGLGSSTPTLTDAMHLLGRLPCGLLGAQMSLDTTAAENAMATIAKALQMDLIEAADTVISVANERVFGALCQLAAANEIDLKTLTLISSGGAGSLQGNALGILTGIVNVIVPAHPAGAAAKEGLRALPSHELSQTILQPLHELSADDLEEVLQKLQKHVKTELQDKKNQDGECKVVAEADLRYCGDNCEVTIDLDLNNASRDPESLETLFSATYSNKTGHTKNDPIELVNVRVVGYCKSQNNTSKPINRWTPINTPIPTHCRVYFDGDFVETAIHDRSSITPERPIQGPAVIVQQDATTIIHPNYRATVCSDDSLLIQPQSTPST